LLVVVVSLLRWWPTVMRDDRPVRRWVWFVPGVLVVSSLLVIDYPNLADAGLGFLVLLAGGSLLVGFGEELMFRGVAVTSMRDTGMAETRVALWSSLLFGGVHITNIITEGPSAIAQVLVVSVAGFFFYLTLRVSGTLVLPMLVHGLWDFAQFSGSIGPEGDGSARVVIAILADLVLAIVLLVRRHSIGVALEEPTAA